MIRVFMVGTGPYIELPNGTVEGFVLELRRAERNGGDIITDGNTGPVLIRPGAITAVVEYRETKDA